MNKKLRKYEKSLGSAQNVVAGFFGIAAKITSPSDLILTTARLVNSGFQGRFINQLDQEFKELQKTTGVRPGSEKDLRVQGIYSSILKELDNNPDETERLELMKKLFFVSLKPDSSEREVLIAHQLNQKAKRLNSMDITMLSAIYQMLCEDKPEHKGIQDKGDWLRLISKRLGGSQSMEQLLVESDRSLVTLGLIHEGRGTEKTNILNMGYFRLTELGLRLCVYAFGPKPVSEDLLERISI